MIILREKSVWLATKQPSATNPFNFFAAVPGIGCNVPYSATVIPGGVCFADTDSQSIYAFTPGGRNIPEAISDAIDIEFFKSINDPKNIFASYDKKWAEYTIAVPSLNETYVKVWIYSFRHKSWTYDERPLLTCVSDLNSLVAALTIDDLPGPSIDTLPWTTIDSMANAASVSSARVYGFNDGEIELENASSILDDDAVVLARVISKELLIPLDISVINNVELELDIDSACTVVLYYSKNKGIAWTKAKTIVYGSTDVGTVRLFSYKKLIRTRNFTWKVELTGLCDLLRYRVNGLKSSIATSADK